MKKLLLIALALLSLTLIGCGAPGHSGSDEEVGSNPPTTEGRVNATVMFAFAELGETDSLGRTVGDVAYPDFEKRRIMAESAITSGLDKLYCVKIEPLDADGNPTPATDDVWQTYTRTEANVAHILSIPVGKVRTSAFVFDNTDTAQGWMIFISDPVVSTIVSGDNPTLPIMLKLNPEQRVKINVMNFPASVIAGNTLSIYDSAITVGANGGSAPVVLPTTSFTGVFNFATEILTAIITLTDGTFIMANKPFSFPAYFAGTGPEIIDFGVFAQTQTTDVTLPGEWDLTIHYGHDDVLTDAADVNYDSVADKLLVVAGETWKIEVLPPNYMPAGGIACSGVVISLKDAANTEIASTATATEPLASLTITFTTSGEFRPYRTMRPGASGNFYGVKATKLSNP